MIGYGLVPLENDHEFPINVDEKKMLAKEAYLQGLRHEAGVRQLSSEKSKRKPNIVLISVDDLGLTDINLYGSRHVSTPHMDALGHSGVIFTDAYASSALCSPSRAGMITGRYQQRFGYEVQPAVMGYPLNRLHYYAFKHLIDTGPWQLSDRLAWPSTRNLHKQGLPPEEITLGELLQAGGYDTAAIGKWHLGYRDPSLLPNARGFDHTYGFYEAFSLYSANLSDPGIVNQHHDELSDPYIWSMGRSGSAAIRRNGREVQEEGYLTSQLAAEAAWFVKRHAGKARGSHDGQERGDGGDHGGNAHGYRDSSTSSSSGGAHDHALQGTASGLPEDGHGETEHKAHAKAHWGAVPGKGKEGGKGGSGHGLHLGDRHHKASKGGDVAKVGDSEGKDLEGQQDPSPFFLYLAFNAPHTPFQVPRHYFDRHAHEPDDNKRTYYAMIEALDDAVGEVMAALRDAGLERDTLVAFASDNGGATYTGATDNAPLKAGKISLFEGGINVPCMMAWEGTIPPGQVFRHPVSLLDLFVTSVSAAGLPLPSDRVYDGVDLIPYVTTSPTGQGGSACNMGDDRMTQEEEPADRSGDPLRCEAPHEALFWRSAHYRAVRMGPWKLLTDGHELLYNLEDDKPERVNVAAQHPDVVARLRRRVELWEKGLMRPLWPPQMNFQFVVDNGGNRGPLYVGFQRAVQAMSRPHRNPSGYPGVRLAAGRFMAFYATWDAMMPRTRAMRSPRTLGQEASGSAWSHQRDGMEGAFTDLTGTVSRCHGMCIIASSLSVALTRAMADIMLHRTRADFAVQQGY
eukprot:jgi/Mesvir1/21463/Mv03919-RA.1